MKIHLLQMDNYSDYIRSLIDQDRMNKRDPEIIRRKITEHEQIIRDLKKLKKQEPIKDNSKINELLNYHAPNYKQSAPFRTEKKRHDFISRALMPGLKKAGFKGSVNEVDELLLNYPDKEVKNGEV